MIIIVLSSVIALVVLFIIVSKARKKREDKENTSTETKKLPNCNYPPFTHVRLIEMGLSSEEVNEFIEELIPQLETQISLIKQAFEESNFQKIEHLTHSIKGSTTNLGTGGISDLLVEFNTYLKTDDDKDTVNAYIEYLKHYTQMLKNQYNL